MKFFVSLLLMLQLYQNKKAFKLISRLGANKDHNIYKQPNSDTDKVGLRFSSWFFTHRCGKLSTLKYLKIGIGPVFKANDKIRHSILNKENDIKNKHRTKK